jgi:hypothetical protein
MMLSLENIQVKRGIQTASIAVVDCDRIQLLRDVAVAY